MIRKTTDTGLPKFHGVQRMSREGVLDRIRDAEARRKAAVEEARKEKDRLLAEARKEARRIADEGAEEAARAAAQRVQAETARIQQERQRTVEQGRRQVELQRDFCAARLPAATERLYQEFLRKAHE